MSIRYTTAAAVIAVGLLVAGCAAGPNHTRAAGGITGAATGALIGGSAAGPEGALVGGIIGAVTGTAVGDSIAREQECCDPCKPCGPVCRPSCPPPCAEGEYYEEEIIEPDCEPRRRVVYRRVVRRYPAPCRRCGPPVVVVPMIGFGFGCGCP